MRKSRHVTKEKIIKAAVKLTFVLLLTVVSVAASGINNMPVYSAAAASMDINDFEARMAVGASQIISVVLYPDDAEDAVTYSSSNPAAATISQGGKIEAKYAGTTEITVKAGSISRTLTLTVVNVTMDINDFEKKMTVGSTQTISAALHPESAKEEIKYSSSNPAAATVSPGGKIEARSAGTTKITVSAGSVSKTLTLTVVNVTMDINDFEKEMTVGSTQTISAALYPESAKEEIKYSSSKPSVATISPGGKIEAKSAGTTKITVKAGGIKRTLKLRVSVTTKGITLNSTYITLRRGEKFKIKAAVSPKDAARKLTYKSSDKSVAKVSRKGTVTATGEGSASVTVSNGDLSASIEVIVNSRTSGGGSMYFGADDEDASDDRGDEPSDITGGVISREKLLKLKKTGKTLTSEKKDYSIIIDGADILNCDNMLYDELHIAEGESGYTFSVGGGEGFLPGEITVRFTDKDMRACRYVYLLDESSDKYRMLGELEDGEFRTDIAGDYRLTYEKLKAPGPDKMTVAITAAVIIAIAVIYLLIRRYVL